MYNIYILSFIIFVVISFVCGNKTRVGRVKTGRPSWHLYKNKRNTKSSKVVTRRQWKQWYILVVYLTNLLVYISITKFSLKLVYFSCLFYSILFYGYSGLCTSMLWPSPIYNVYKFLSMLVINYDIIPFQSVLINR